MITNQEIVEEVVSQFGEAVTNFEEPFGLLTFTVSREQIIPVLTHLYQHSTYQFMFLTDLTGIHFPDATGREFAVVYHLHSFKNNVRIRLKVFLPEADLRIPTAVNLFPTANWMERETFDFYGINFEGHPNLKRILNMEDMNYFPMRRQYPLEDATRNDKIDALFGR